MDDFFDELTSNVEATESSGKKSRRTRHDGWDRPPLWVVVLGLVALGAILVAKFTGNLPD